MRFYSLNSLLKCGLFVFSVVVFFRYELAYAEGSRDLIKYAIENGGGHRPYLEYSSNETAGIQHKAIIKVFVYERETVYLGSSVSSNTIDPYNDIIYRTPSGETSGCDVIQWGEGSIDSLDKEKFGPKALDKRGYITTPGECQFTVEVEEEGVYEVEFYSPDIDAETPNFGNPPNKRVGDPLVIDGEQQKAVAAWDITVIGIDNLEKKGRVYANYLPLHMGNKGTQLNAQVFILSDTGYLYRTNLNKNDPWQFMFFANNKGFKKNDTGEPLYKSIDIKDGLPNNIDVHNPSWLDTKTDVTHKIFLNPPAPDLPESAPSPSGKTWLLNTQEGLPKISNFVFTGSEGTPGQAGVGMGGAFSFETDKNGNYILTIDFNNNGVYGDEVDRVLTGAVTIGENTIWWDGQDGQQNIVGASSASYQTKLSLIISDVHFPFFDVENNPYGLIVEQVNPETLAVENDIVYYNNPKKLAGGIPPVPTSATAGVSSSNGAQIFTGGFGNNKGIDTWTSIAKPVALPGGLNIKEAQLIVEKDYAPESPVPGGLVFYTIKVKNAGPSNAKNIQVIDNLPSVIGSPTWTCMASPPNHCHTASGAGHINAKVDLNNGAEATFSIIGVVNAAVGETVTNNVSLEHSGIDFSLSEESQLNTSTRFTLASPPEDIDPPTTESTTFFEDKPIEETTPLPFPVDETIPYYIIKTVPLNGTLYLGHPDAGGTSIPSGKLLMDEEITQVFIEPAADFEGKTSFSYVVANEIGLVSEPAMLTVAIDTAGPPIENPSISLPLTMDLTVSFKGQGQGRVDTDPVGIHCHSSDIECQHTYETTTWVKLVPKADKDAYFVGWGGKCDEGQGTISVFMNKNIYCEAYFAPLPTTLTVTYTGEGQLTSQVAGGTEKKLTCQQKQCTARFDINTAVTLIATPAMGWQFDGWQGHCDTQGQVNMTMDKACQATFSAIPVVEPDPLPVVTPLPQTPATTDPVEATPTNTITSTEPGDIPCEEESCTIDEPDLATLTLTVIGRGQVTSADLECNQRTCQKTYPTQTVLTLTPQAVDDWQFDRWEGAGCEGQVTMTTDRTCLAIFTPPLSQPILMVGVVNDGIITSEPSGIDCNEDCIENFNGQVTTMTLTAVPDTGAVFTHWQGDCEGQANPITLTVDSIKVCVAYFTHAEKPVQKVIERLSIDLKSFKAIATAKGILLRWKTEAEIDTVGFHLWRALRDEKRHYTRIIRLTDKPIFAEGNMTTGATYTYLDTHVVPGQKYHYGLEDIDMWGQYTFFWWDFIDSATALKMH